MRQFPGSFFLRNLIGHRALLVQLVRRDFQQRFVGSIAGWTWGLIHPLVLLACWTFVFQVCLNAPLPENAATSSYSLFLFAGFLPWLLFQDTMSRSATSLVEQSVLITKTVFPSEIVPVSVFLSSLLSHGLSLILVIGAVLLVEGRLGPGLVALPFYTLLAGLFSIGLAWAVSSVQVYLRDTVQFLGMALTVWFWVTPIFIAPEIYPEAARALLRLNPLSYLVNGYRQMLLAGSLPPLIDLAALCFFSIGMFVLGGLIFRHLKRGFADVL